MYCITVLCLLTSWFVWQVLWEMLTREIPFKGLEGLQVAWLVVEKNEVFGVWLYVYSKYSFDPHN